MFDGLNGTHEQAHETAPTPTPTRTRFTKIDQARNDENDLLLKYVKSSLPLAIFPVCLGLFAASACFHKPCLYSADGTGTSECF